MKIIIPTALQNILKVIKTSFVIWKHALIKTIPFSLIYLIINSLLLAPLDKLAKIDDKFLDQFSLSLLFSGKYLLIASKIVLSSFVFFVANASIIYILNKVDSNENVSFTQAIKVGYKKTFLQLLIFILELVMVGGPILLILILWGFPNISGHFKLATCFVCALAFILGYIILVYLMFAIYQLIIEENSIIDSIKNSFNLISGNWWYMFGVYLICSVVSYLYDLVFDHLFIKDSVYVSFFLKNSFSTILGLPLLHAFMITILYNLKTKKRAWLEVGIK